VNIDIDQLQGFLGLSLMSGLVAALATQGILWLRDLSADKRSKRYGGMRIALALALALEEFTINSALVVQDVDRFVGSANNIGSPPGKMPEIPEYPSDIDLQHLPDTIVEAALLFRILASGAQGAIDDHYSAGNPTEYCFAYCTAVSNNALSAYRVATRIRERLRLNAAQNRVGGWNFLKVLERHATQERDIIV
jgi:hypothetical protein